MGVVTSLLAEAFALHQAGRLAEAEQTYNRILATQPDHFDTLHLLGIVFHQRGDHAQALLHIDRALKISPNNIPALNNRGIALRELRRFEEALASYDSALALWPDYAEALLGRGNALKELQRFDEALASYDRTLTLRPDWIDAHVNRGNVLHALKRFDEALASYDRALALQPDLAEAHANRGSSLHQLKRFEAALASHDRALALRPNYTEARYNRGNALHALKRFEEALADYELALALRPDYVEALANRGVTLHELKRFAAALDSQDRALAMRPDYAEAFVNRGVILHELKRFDEALASYERAIALRPDYAQAHYNEAVCRMLTGDFGRGWQKLEWGWDTAQLKNLKREFSQPLWLGSDEIAGKTVLLHGVHGFGDTIQFCRYVPRVVERGARVILEVQEPLRELMDTLPGAAQIVTRGAALPDFDQHCPLLSLPLAFGTRLATIPAQIPYLRATAQAVTDWNARLGPRPRIGLAWSGRPEHNNDHNRSMRLSTLLSPLAGFEATYVSLQREVRADDAPVLQGRSDIVHFGEELKTYADTAALIANLDLVISVDTSVAHLAGALAKPVWILLPFIPDWRWLLDREDSPWYPTARLFRQDETRGWDNVMARVHVALIDPRREFS
jgi:tetratricopeptide (TPR) repeat protein